VKRPTLPGTRRRTDIVPEMKPFARARMVWWTELLLVTMLLAVPILMFYLAGGDWADVATRWRFVIGRGQVPTLPPPLLVAVASVFVMSAAATLGEWEGRISERRNFHRWYAAHHAGQPTANPTANPTFEPTFELGTFELSRTAEMDTASPAYRTAR
jgi:hypothetical protein